jgi:hypothetical protein
MRVLPFLGLVHAVCAAYLNVDKTPYNGTVYTLNVDTTIPRGTPAPFKIFPSHGLTKGINESNSFLPNSTKENPSSSPILYSKASVVDKKRFSMLLACILSIGFSI